MKHRHFSTAAQNRQTKPKVALNLAGHRKFLNERKEVGKGLTLSAKCFETILKTFNAG